MCGIAGFLESSPSVEPHLLDAMVRSLYSRGPDGEGRFISGPAQIGMRRLAILDPAHGQQPFATQDGRFVAMCNGEIYNHRSLRRELEGKGVRFETECDAEVLPHAFAAWGADELALRLDGMFGIVLLDTRERALHLFRDRYGEKPIFYSATASRFVFASQLATMTLPKDFDFEVDPVALRHYLFLHYVPGERTIFERVRRLEAGHRLEVSWDRPMDVRIADWRRPIDSGSEIPRSYGAAVNATRSRLERAVQSRLISDVPVGVFLSGGLDSSAVAAAVARHKGGVRTFSVGFEDASLDESGYARAVAQHIGAEHHHFSFDLDACLSVLDRAMDVLDEPVGDPACLPVLLLSKNAREHVKVVLTGEGADEFFGGYGYYPGFETLGQSGAPTRRDFRLAGWFGWARAAAHAGVRPVSNSLTAFFQADNSTPSGFPGLTNSIERNQMVPGAVGDEDAWSQGLVGRLSEIDCGLRRAQTADIESWLAGDLLPKLDHMTMGVSLEGRAPFLDPALAEFALAMPAAWKVDAKGRKRVLRDAVSSWLPADILVRKKQGFVLPIGEWLMGPLKERLLDGLREDRGDGLDAAVAYDLVESDLKAGAPRARLLYALLAYRDWMKSLRERRAEAIRYADGALP